MPAKLAFNAMASRRKLDASTLQRFENAAAGHDGVMSDPTGELVIKPCTDAEIFFYQQTVESHPDFVRHMPTFMGTLALSENGASASEAAPALTQAEKDQRLLHGAKLSTATAIVLENLEHGFKYPNVIDLKLGARLYAPGTDPEKAARLDKTAAESTSASLHFRVAGMKVWNGEAYTIYDKFYGRKFAGDNVQDAFTAYFGPLAAALSDSQADATLSSIREQLDSIIGLLQRDHSRMFSASVLIVYEGDAKALQDLVSGAHAPPPPSDEEDGEELESPVAFKVKMIDFAHARWCPTESADDNVLVGLRNVKDRIKMGK